MLWDRGGTVLYLSKYTMGAWNLWTHTGKSACEHGPQWALPTSAPVPSTCPFVFVVGPHLKWSRYGHERAGRRRKCRRGQYPSGPVFVCVFSCRNRGWALNVSEEVYNGVTSNHRIIKNGVVGAYTG